MNLICPACGFSNTEKNKILFFQGQRGLVQWERCNKCFSFFLTQNYEPDKEVEHTITKTAWGPDESGKNVAVFKERMFLAISEKIRKYFPTPASLLDIGCSYGGFLKKMDSFGYQVSGIDIVPNAVNYVKSRGLTAHVAHSIRDIDSTFTKWYDIVTILDCNCYWENQNEQLTAIYEHLNNQGLLVMRVADKSMYFHFGKYLNNLSTVLGQKLMRVSVNDHRFSMPLKSLIKLLKTNNFEIIKISAVDAIHGSKTRLIVKILFIAGNMFRILTGINLAPGLVIYARKIKG